MAVEGWLGWGLVEGRVRVGCGREGEEAGLWCVWGVTACVCSGRGGGRGGSGPAFRGDRGPVLERRAWVHG